MSLTYTVRPLSDRTWLRPDDQRKQSQFNASWADTLEILDREVRLIKGRNVVFECDVRGERDLRNDGLLRANAVLNSPAVVVAMESKYGPLLYRSDRYGSRPYFAKMDKVWQHNVRAVALTLESLRAVDRYGASETGQQYTGYKALPAGRAMPASHMTADDAWAIIGSFGEGPISEQRASMTGLDAAFRKARQFAHPDRHNGDRTLWDQVEEAGIVLGVRR